MTTAAQWCDEVRELLGSGVIEQVNRLAEDYEPGDGVIKLQRDITGVVPNQVVTCGLNAFLVWEVDATTKTLTVEPKWAAAPEVVMESGSLVRMRPNLYTHRILKAINDTLNELSSPLNGVYAVAVQDIDENPSIGNYDLAQCENIDKVLRVQWGYPDDAMSMWHDLNHGTWQHRQMEPTADFPSGHQLRLFVDVDSGATLRVIYSRGPSTLDTLEDDVAMTYLPETCWDLPVLGAAARLAAGMEYRRNILAAQPDTRRSDEVQPSALQNAYRGLLADFNRRVQQEAARLAATYPPKLK
jgi:hypothetical protein